ncbi:MAG: caspase family protein [Nitrospira sp.]
MRTSKRRRLLSFGVGLLLLLASNEGHAGAFLDLRAEHPSKLHILAIGINKYSGEIGPLRYARTDAEAVVEALKQSFKGTVQWQELLDEQATREAIEVAMEKIIADAKPQDLFVLYFGGSSQVGPDKEFYLLSVNVIERQGDFLSQAISSNLLKAWLSRIQANKQLVILDSCDGKQPMASVVSRIEEEDIRGARLSDRRVMIVGTDGLAMEVEKLKHGVLTLHLLHCLTSAADVLPKDGVITARELDVSIRGQTTLWQKSGIEQAVVSVAVGRDFVVAHVHDYRGVADDEIPLQDRKSESADGGPGRD